MIEVASNVFQEATPIEQYIQETMVALGYNGALGRRKVLGRLTRINKNCPCYPKKRVSI